MTTTLVDKLLENFDTDPRKQKQALVLIAHRKELKQWKDYRSLKGSLMRLEARSGVQRILSDALKSVNLRIGRMYHEKRKRSPPYPRTEQELRTCELCATVFVGQLYLRNHLLSRHDLLEAIRVLSIKRVITRRQKYKDEVRVYTHVEEEIYLPQWCDATHLATSKVKSVLKKKGEKYLYYYVGKVRVQQIVSATHHVRGTFGAGAKRKTLFVVLPFLITIFLIMPKWLFLQ